MNESLMQTLLNFIDSRLANLHTITIAKITQVNQTTINCKPVINRVINEDSIELPEFVEVPPVFLQGGASYLAHPLAVGDYCLLLINERCFDHWYMGNDNLPPAEKRLFDYSDAIALVGINPLAGAIAIPSMVQMTGDTNQDGDYSHQGNRSQTGNYTLNGDMVVNGNVMINGNLTVSGTIAAGNFTGLGGGDLISSSSIKTTQDVVAGGISLKGHKHIDSEGRTTGGPI